MTDKITFIMRLTKSPKLIDVEQDLWIFYCSYCHRWCKGTRHGYNSDFFSQAYFECENGHRTEAPGWWK